MATAVIEQCVQVVCSEFDGLLEDAPSPERVWVLPKNAPEPYQPYQLDADPYGDYSEGRWIWLLSDIKAVEPPVETRGFQGLWTLPKDIERDVRARERQIQGA